MGTHNNNKYKWKQCKKCWNLDGEHTARIFGDLYKAIVMLLFPHLYVYATCEWVKLASGKNVIKLKITINQLAVFAHTLTKRCLRCKK